MPLIPVQDRANVESYNSHYENNPDTYSLDLASSYLAGLGIGLLATAAVSLSPNLVDLPIAGAEVVRTAFRLGVVVDQVSQNLQPRELTDSGTPDTWAYVIPDVTPERVQKELDVIHTNEVCPPLFFRLCITRLRVTRASTLYPAPYLLYLYPLPQYTIITFPHVPPTPRGTDVAMTENARGKQNLHQRSQ